MKTRKKIGIIVTVVLLFIAWGFRICQLRQHWETMYPIKYVEMTDHFVQNGLEFHLIEYHWTNIEELAGRFVLYPFLYVCNEEGATEVRAKESTRYTGVYLVVEGEPPKYLVFGRDGCLLKVRLEEGMEMIDGKLVET